MKGLLLEPENEKCIGGEVSGIGAQLWLSAFLYPALFENSSTRPSSSFGRRRNIVEGHIVEGVLILLT